MSTVLSLHEGAQAILAQIGNPTPEAPPAPDAGLQASRGGVGGRGVGVPRGAVGGGRPAGWVVAQSVLDQVDDPYGGERMSDLQRQDPPATRVQAGIR
uniref:hypothetical protein n=1 Tax=Nocardia cyriacigeorgica TaxID=135487 RepID=UPI0024580DE3